VGVKDYRYGFNGKEEDDEVKGDGNQQDYGMRIYDPRLGRFLSVDPISKKYPELTPYQFASNTPIMGIDLDGLELYTSTGFDIWFFFKFGLRAKANEISENSVGKLMSGTVQLAQIESNETNPQQSSGTPEDELPAMLKRNLELKGKVDAYRKMVEGTAKMYEISGETMLEVAGFVLPVEKAIAWGIKGTRQLLRLKVAAQVYEKAGYVAKKIADHLKYYDFELPVFKKTVEEQTELIQFRLKKSESTMPGDYYAPKGTKPEEIGLSSDDVDFDNSYTVTLNKKVDDVVVSTHKRNTELYYAPGSGRKSEGGGIQYFSPEIKKEGNATFKKGVKR
jgi:RHS repeat-associated protein